MPNPPAMVGNRIPYQFSFHEKDKLKTHQWIRYGTDMEDTFALAKEAARYEYPDCGGFYITRLYP